MVMGISYSSSNPHRVYFVSDTAQVWRSDDGGDNWKSKPAGFSPHGGRSLTVHPDNSDIVAVAGFFPHPQSFSSKMENRRQGVYLTKDGGESWELKLATDFYRQDSQGSVILFDPRESGSLLVGSWSEGLLRSSDLGKSWECLGLVGKHIIDIATSAVSKDIYIATEKGFFRYDGSGFHLLNNLPSWVRSVAVSGEGLVWVALGSEGVFFSRDRGRTFHPRNAGLPIFMNVTDVEVSPVTPERLYCKNSLTPSAGIYYSHDLGNSWHEPVTYDATGLNPTDKLFYFPSPIAAHPFNKDKALIASNGKGLLLATDDGGFHLYYSSSGFTGGRLGAIAFGSDDVAIFGLYDHGLYVSRDGYQTFQHLNMSFPWAQQTVLACDRKGSIIATISEAHNKPRLVSVSRDDGLSWLHNELPSQVSPPFIYIEDGDGRVIYASGKVSRDGGDTWYPLKYPCVAARKIQDELAIYGLASNNEAFKLMKSVDSGQTWTEVTPWCQIPDRKVHEVAVDQYDACYVAAGHFGVFSWMPGGRWQKSFKTDKKFHKINIKRVLVTNDGGLYAGSWAPGVGQGDGVFFSKDQARTFSNITNELGPFLTVWCLGFSEKEKTVFIGTSRGTYRKVVGNANHDGK